MKFDFQPVLENEIVRLEPLKSSDFESLFSVASNPVLWQQHPNPDRYKHQVFKNFFKGAMESGGAFKLIDKHDGSVIGSSRFYDLNEAERKILIGYSFVAVSHWGKSFNPAMKKLMLDHAFQFVDSVEFHIGATNFRSQKAIEKIGATKSGEKSVEYFGEPEKLNFVYTINKEQWNKINKF